MNVASKFIIVLLSFAGLLSAETVSGTLRNGTTHRPSAGDQVVLLRFGQGLQEVAHTISDANGRYSFTFPATGPHVVRAIHAGQVYDRDPHPGAKSVDFEVFDIAHHVTQISTPLVLLGLQPRSGALDIVELQLVENASNPPMVAEGSGYETQLPVGAQLEWARGMAAGQRPVNISPVRTADTDLYRLPFALRPGQTRLQVAYRLAYSSNVNVTLQFPVAVPRLVIVVPKGLHLTAANELQLQRVAERDSEVELIKGVAAGQKVSFRVIGTGFAGNTVTRKTAAEEQQPTPIPLGKEANIVVTNGAKAQSDIETSQHSSRRNTYILFILMAAISVVIFLRHVVYPRLLSSGLQRRSA